MRAQAALRAESSNESPAQGARGSCARRAISPGAMIGRDIAEEAERTLLRGGRDNPCR